ncbi:TonB-dependent receptor plug domain-containing protein [Moraxella catarrhalis]|uniref:TonB-dependent receptor n=1 Tax=Moraxella catarrhalis TaxID=480 RepID=A0A198ULW3_MORCA|nr:TonB-dependent receptor [Moraxella catarrhalis]OAU97279.1 TonB-dependent receptor [Moraxella catarrhalis]OAU98568.1 TonB-dependent receptor [Moraxella catarrhalis]OAV00001.1 TonB-dependent receptor [Moraxella catarrhalis]
MSSFTLRRAIVLALAPLSAAAFAQDTQPTEPTVILDPVIVTASKTDGLLSQTPVRVSVIGAREIRQNPTLNLSDVLQKDASISVKQSGGIGQIPQVSLRGTHPKHTLIARDSARLNNQNELSPVFAGFYDLSDVDQVEIVKGAASVQYGSDAIGGVINMISKTPTQSGGFVTGVYGENKTYKVIVGEDLVADNGLYAQVRGQRLETDGTRILESQKENNKASYDQKGGSFKLGYNANTLKTSVGISHNEGIDIFTNDYITNTSPREFENQVINANIAYDVMPDTVISARYAHISDKQNVPAHGSQYNTRAHEGDINVRWKLHQDHNFLAGVAYNNAEFESNTIINGLQEVESYGYYLQHQYNNSKFSTQAGVRMEDNDRFGTHTVGQLAGRYHLNPQTSIYANVGTAFRAPTLNEMYSQWGGNPNLDPEESLSYEVGINHYVGNNFSIGLSAYRTEIDNLISWSNGKNNNMSEATFKGGELGVKWQNDNFYINANYARTETENKATAREIAYRPKNSGTLTVGYDDGEYGVSVSTIARSKAATSNDASDVYVRGYATMDVNAHWQATQNVKLFTNIQNLWDRQHRLVYNTWPKADWYVNGGRQANVGVTFGY